MRQFGASGTDGLSGCTKSCIKLFSALFEPFLEKYWDKIDQDGSKDLNFKEWKLMVFSFAYAHSTIVFRGFDEDNNKELDAEELEKLFDFILV